MDATHEVVRTLDTGEEKQIAKGDLALCEHVAGHNPEIWKVREIGAPVDAMDEFMKKDAMDETHDEGLKEDGETNPDEAT